MLHVERSNRTERLLEGLADRLIAAGRDPLVPATVVVQGPGMERWIAQQVARRHGVCANVEFLYPRAFLERAFASVSPGMGGGPGTDPGAAEAWEPSRLLWSIAAALPALLEEPDFEAVRRHLEHPDRAWRLVQLAGRLAALFDQYLDYRPEWMIEWSGDGPLPTGRETRWQARLVRHLAEGLGMDHFASRARAFGQAMRGAEGEKLADLFREAFPDPVELFALSALPPAHLATLDALAARVPVHVSILSPSRSYWSDLWRELRDEAPASADPTGGDLFAAARVPPAGRLLAGLGRLGADLQGRLETLDHIQEDGIDRHVSPAELARDRPLRLLERLQADLLDLDGDIGWNARDAAKPVIPEDDDSFSVHVCHGPRRELEVVFARLRAAFDRDPTLRPEDVIVMAPEIDEIASEIDAVFGARAEGALGIPYRIADRGALRRSPVAGAFGALLELLTARITRGELLDWLARPPVRERFGLAEDAVERLTGWAESAGVRFGLDGRHRADLELAPEDRHTWRGGLARLALAHAVGAEGEARAGLAPTPLDSFSDPAVLGALGDLEELLEEARVEVRRPRSVAAWCAWLGTLLDRSCARSDRAAYEHVRIRETIQAMAEAARAAGFEAPIPFEAIREQLVVRIEATPPPQAFLAGGVTFCELVPLRAIPFRIVVILGLADDAFPRGRPAPRYDLMAAAPRPGDRSQRQDDRGLFLEAILSARDRLMLTVPGRDLRDGSDRPPSVVVSDLLDMIEASYRMPGGDGRALREHLLVEHALQASSMVCFDADGDERKHGRDPDDHAGALARLESEAGRAERRRFLDLDAHPLSRVVRQAPISLELDALVARLGHATRSFVRDRLGLKLPRPEEGADELDPLSFTPLDRWAFGDALLEHLAAGGTLEDGLRRVAVRPKAPVGAAAPFVLAELAEEVRTLWQIGEHRCGGPGRPDHAFALELEVAGHGPVRLEGVLDRLHPGGRVEVQFARRSPRHELGVWIRHLALCAAVEEGLDVAAESCLVGRPKHANDRNHVTHFAAVGDPRGLLRVLVGYALALDDAPLPLLPRASSRFAAARDEVKGRQQANHAYHGGDAGSYDRPEAEEELEHAVLWEGCSPIDPATTASLAVAFDVLARDVFRPLYEKRGEAKA